MEKEFSFKTLSKQYFNFLLIFPYFSFWKLFWKLQNCISMEVTETASWDQAVMWFKNEFYWLILYLTLLLVTYFMLSPLGVVDWVLQLAEAQL